MIQWIPVLCRFSFQSSSFFLQVFWPYGLGPFPKNKSKKLTDFLYVRGTKYSLFLIWSSKWLFNSAIHVVSILVVLLFDGFNGIIKFHYSFLLNNWLSYFMYSGSEYLCIGLVNSLRFISAWLKKSFLLEAGKINILNKIQFPLVYGNLFYYFRYKLNANLDN